jgi:hypoxanthine phosphoribosyltransferase
VVTKKIYITWETIENLVLDLSKQIPKDIKFIHGLSRGGLIPAVMLSHITGIPFRKSPAFCEPGEVLVVDDICDSGETLQTYKDYPTAVLHHKPHTACMEPTMYAKLHEGDEWIIYPWEREDSETIQDYKLDK